MMYRPRALLPAALHLFLLVFIVNGHLDPRRAPPLSFCDLFIEILISCDADCSSPPTSAESALQSCLCQYTDHNKYYMFDDATVQCQECLDNPSHPICCHDHDCSGSSFTCIDYNSNSPVDSHQINFASQVSLWSGYCSKNLPVSTPTQAAETATSSPDAAASTTPNHTAEIVLGVLVGVFGLALLGIGAFWLRKRWTHI